MTHAPASPSGYLSFTLHAHLPWVVNHGTWPHGMEWLHEAAAETYLPLLRALDRLHADGIALHANLNLSPVLCEQLAHPVFQAEFPRYLERKILAAREDEAFFLSSGEPHYAETARFWNSFFSAALTQFQSLGADILAGFRLAAERGQVEIITCGATHGYMPLLGTDESLRAQVRTAVSTHRRHFNAAPAGIWVPECGYRPAGPWSFPLRSREDQSFGPATDRIGVEEALAESALAFFFVDSHLIDESSRSLSPYAPAGTPLPAITSPADNRRRLYQPYFVDGPGAASQSHPVAVFPRDPATGLQVWSGDHGYPGDGAYLDFHKKRWPGGHRYWRVTGHGVDIGDKQPYHPAEGAARVAEHARHFVSLAQNTLAGTLDPNAPPILCAPFDAELFGHWWFEGVLWLEAVARELHARFAQSSGEAPALALISATRYLTRFPPTASVRMPEGSWGAEGDNQVWLNGDTAWTYTDLYPAELFLRDVCSSPLWQDDGPGLRLARQLCRELLLLESSDWQFLITTGAARDYAELRFSTHRDQFGELQGMWHDFAALGALTPAQQERLEAIETRDSLFPDIDPAWWRAPSPTPALDPPKRSPSPL